MGALVGDTGEDGDVGEEATSGGLEGTSGSRVGGLGVDGLVMGGVGGISPVMRESE